MQKSNLKLAFKSFDYYNKLDPDADSAAGQMDRHE